MRYLGLFLWGVIKFAVWLVCISSVMVIAVPVIFGSGGKIVPFQKQIDKLMEWI